MRAAGRLASGLLLGLCVCISSDARPRPVTDVPRPSIGGAGTAGSTGGPRVDVIVLVLIDTLRADHLGAYGAAADSTPRLDALADRAYVFEQATATSSWTRASVASMLTSRYPGSVQVRGRDDVIADDILTFPEVLAARGWFTSGVFANGNASPAIGFGQGFARIHWPTLVRGYPGDFQKFTAEGVTLAAIQAVREWRTEAPSRPLFLFAHYIDPHDPYLPHPDLLSDPEPAGRFSGARPELHALDRLGRFRRTAGDVARIKHLYAGEVRYCDRWVGLLLDELQTLGLMERALVIVTADHGEGLWDHGRRGHGVDLYQEQIHVPLIMRDARMTPPDAVRIPTPVSLLDVAPTILAAAGIDPPTTFEGHDLTPLLRGIERPATLGYVYAELDLDGRSFDAMRVGASKLVRRRGALQSRLHPPELFRLDRDPGEIDDLTRRHFSLTYRLTAAADAWSAAIASRAGERMAVPAHALDPRTQEQLRGLGYLQ